MKTIRVSKKVAEEFFRNEGLFEESRIDGYDIDDMIWMLTRRPVKHISTQIDGKVIAITAYDEGSSSHYAEVHTFVLPEYRKHAVEALKGHIEYFRSMHIHCIHTACSNFNISVKNFLTKRLGFVVYGEEDTSYTKDGKPVTIYKLIKVVIDA